MVVAACVVFALGVNGLGSAASLLQADHGALPFLRGGGLALAMLATLALLIHRRRMAADRRAADPVASTIGAALVILGLFAVLAIAPLMMGPSESTPGPPPPERSVRGGADRPGIDPPMEDMGGLVRASPRERPQMEASPAAPPPPAEDPVPESQAVNRLLQIGMVILAFIVLAIVLSEALRRALAMRAPPLALAEAPQPVPAAARELEIAMQKSVEGLSAEGPATGNQITSAYNRLLSALERVGFARQPQEAPHEHLHRALLQLGVSAVPMQRLTELYVFAEFGRGEIGEAHRSAASSALATSLEALRARYPQLVADTAAAGTGSAAP